MPALDLRFGAPGLPVAASHEIAAAGPGEASAACGFALALLSRLLAMRPKDHALCIQDAAASREHGAAYGPGLHAYGVDPDRLIFVAVPNATEALRVTDEALRSGALSAVLTEFWDDKGKLDLATTKRFNLAAERTGTGCFLLTRNLAGTSAAVTRWRVGSGRSRPPAPSLIGAPVFHLELTRNRFGPTGQWTVEWDCHDHLFRTATDVVRLARPAGDRSLAEAAQRAGQAHGHRRQVG
jgi:protein ImuA